MGAERMCGLVLPKKLSAWLFVLLHSCLAINASAPRQHKPLLRRSTTTASGHKDVKILLNTYYNPQGEDLAGLLD